MEGTDDFDLEAWVQSEGINTSGSFSLPRKCERSPGTKVSLTGTGAVIQKFKNAVHPPEIDGISEGGHGENIHASAWNVSAVLCGDASSGFQKGIYYGSGSSDGAARGFWPMEWDTLNLICRYGISDSYVSWPFRPVSRLVRLKRRNRKPPLRLTINIEGYLYEIAIQLIKQCIHDWLSENRGFCLIIGGPGARAPNPVLSIFMIRCFGLTPYRSNDEGRDCVIHAACNVMFLLVGERSAAYEVNRLRRSIKLASARCRPHTEGCTEVSDLLKIGHLGPIFQNAGGHLGIRKMIIPRHGHLQSIACRFNWLFEKKYYGSIFVARLFEAHVVDHVIVIDSRRWPSLIYDSSDLCPIMLSSLALFHCAGPGANKVKIVDLYEVFGHQRKHEICDEFEQELLTLPRGSAPLA